MRRLTAEVAAGTGPLRIWVVPLDRLQVDSGGVTAAHLALRPVALVGRLYDHVDRPGTYAILFSGPGSDDRGGFYAYQWARGGTVYDVRAAARHAIDCCAPSYPRMLDRFVADSDTVLRRHHSSGPVGDPRSGLDDPGFTSSTGSAPDMGLLALLGIGAVVAVGLVGAATRSRRTPSPGGAFSALATPDPADLEELRGPLREEIEQVRQEIGAAEATTTDAAALAHAGTARQLLDRAPRADARAALGGGRPAW